ncbi:MAG: 16S rRNA (guanine(966)-N(2))-methyltransferase RsmD [Verrucomicrobia bacterium]|nr:16S rRNA (guanine(966)-N(2))-methyltransferase RsmD [Verrucomicrobiota bacterium]
MRIISGTAGGTILKVPEGLGVRPTPDQVRQALFNSLGIRVAGAKVLELFGGTGALSLESISRGAQSAVCVEKSAKHAQFIRRNLELAKLPAGSLQTRVQDAFIAIAQMAAAGEKFDLILADPPYGEKNVNRRSTSFAQKMLDDVHLAKLLPEHGLFVLGHTKRDTLTFPPAWEEVKMLKHGDTVMRILKTNVRGQVDELPEKPAGK